MYIPSSFRNDDLRAVHALIMDYNFGTLFSRHDGRPCATHIPVLIDPGAGPKGTLAAHMARANPHWKGFEDGEEVLVMFQGPHSYISPAWYRNQKTVPTWNYAAVHAYGVPRLITDPADLRFLIEKLVRYHESQVGNLWDIRQAESIMDANLRGIVGFEIPIARIDGKFKFNQNLPAADREGVVRALEKSADQIQRAVASIMRRNL